MSRVISLRLKEDEATRLERLARQFGRSPGETAALLLREKLNEEEFPFVEFRSSIVGRQAYLKGRRLTVWQVVLLARSAGLDARRIAELLEVPEEQVQAALAYARAHPDEIDPVVEEVDSATVEDLRRKIPWLKVVEIG